MIMKRVKVFLFWIAFLWACMSVWSWMFPGNNEIPEELIERTRKEVGESLESPFEFVPAADLGDGGMYDKYAFNIVIDLSLSTSPDGRRAENRDRFYVELIRSIYDSYVRAGFDVRTYFFGTSLVQVDAMDLATFSLDKLKYYKGYDADDDGYRLDAYTDILSALEMVVQEMEQPEDDGKEKYLILISDDIHDTPGGTRVEPARLQALRRRAQQLENTSFVFYRYEGGASSGSIRNYVRNNLAGLFTEEPVEFRNIAGKLVANIRNDMYYHDLVTLKGEPFVVGDSCALPGSLSPVGEYRKSNGTLSCSRFRAEFVGAATHSDRTASAPLSLYPDEGVTYFNFKFVNDYDFFPIKVHITGISLPENPEVQMALADIKDFHSTVFVLAPESEVLWTLPVEVSYKAPWYKGFRGASEWVDELYLSYELEFPDPGKSVSDYLSNRLGTNPRFSMNDRKLYYKGEQLSFLAEKNIAGVRERLLVKRFPTHFARPLSALALLTLCLLWTKSGKPKLTGWQVIREGKTLRTAGVSQLSVVGDYNDSNGDVVITATRYVVNWNPFRKQPRDGITLYFRYPVSVLNEDDEVLGLRKQKVYLAPNKRYRIMMFDNITLQIK